MCGILGMINTRISKHDFVNCLEKIKHRGPDDYGVLQLSNIFLGHRRLSIQDLSANGHQPMKYNDYILIFNGEIYNFLDLKKKLKNVAFKGHSDTEVLLHYLIQFGIEETLNDLDGMFAFSFYDIREQKLFLARDHIGEKPLYYGNINDEFIFASELTAIEEHPNFNRTIDSNSVNTFLTYKYIPAPSSIYKDIKKLEAGSYLVHDLKSNYKVVKYYDYLDNAFHNKFESNIIIDNPIDMFEKLLIESVEERLLSDVPVGSFLSGGYDSSLIVGILSKKLNRNIDTFTIGFESKEYDESKHAKKIANYLGTSHHEIILQKKQIIQAATNIHNIYDEPFADSSQIPTYLVSEFASNHVKVVLSGDGGDELFAGYNRYFMGSNLKYSMKGKAISFLLKMGLSNIVEALMLIYKNSNKDSIKLLPAKEHITRLKYLTGSRNNDQTYSSLMMNYDYKNDIRNDNSYLDILKISNTKINKFNEIEKLMIYDAISFLQNDIFTKLDRATMSVNIEGRVPFVSKKLIDFAWQLPFEYKYNNGKRKYIIYELLKRYYPRELYERPKSGFSIPLGDWFKNELKDYVNDTINSRNFKNDEFINQKNILKILDMHKKGKGDWTQSLWNVMMYINWKSR